MLTPYGERGEKVGETQHEGVVCSISIYEVYCQFCLDNVPDSLFCPVKVCPGSDIIGQSSLYCGVINKSQEKVLR